MNKDTAIEFRHPQLLALLGLLGSLGAIIALWLSSPAFPAFSSLDQVTVMVLLGAIMVGALSFVAIAFGKPIVKCDASGIHLKGSDTPIKWTSVSSIQAGSMDTGFSSTEQRDIARSVKMPSVQIALRMPLDSHWIRRHRNSCYVKFPNNSVMCFAKKLLRLPVDDAVLKLLQMKEQGDQM